jgi:hypothetical protein
MEGWRPAVFITQAFGIAIVGTSAINHEERGRQEGIPQEEQGDGEEMREKPPTAV